MPRTRDEVYDKLHIKFRQIFDALDDYSKTDLDGILWALALEITTQGEKCTENSIRKT